MNSDFPRILTLLRKEKGISQKESAAKLGISQALLSHYEKGIRECGLDFLVRCADFYSVSCDYLLGRSPERTGSTIAVGDIPESDSSAERENQSIDSILPVLNKKLISNSINILFSLLTKAGSKALTTEVSSFLMLAVYRMMRVLHSANNKNQEVMFGVPTHSYSHYADAAMQISEANALASARGGARSAESFKDKSALIFNTESLAEQYPAYSSSLLNLIQKAEQKIDFSSNGSK